MTLHFVWGHLTRKQTVQHFNMKKRASLFVFSMVGSKQNAGSLLTQVSDTVFHALSHGTFGFALHGSFFNHVLIGGNSSNSQSDSLE